MTDILKLLLQAEQLVADTESSLIKIKAQQCEFSEEFLSRTTSLFERHAKNRESLFSTTVALVKTILPLAEIVQKFKQNRGQNVSYKLDEFFQVRKGEERLIFINSDIGAIVQKIPGPKIRRTISVEEFVQTYRTHAFCLSVIEHAKQIMKEQSEDSAKLKEAIDQCLNKIVELTE